MPTINKAQRDELRVYGLAVSSDARGYFIIDLEGTPMEDSGIRYKNEGAAYQAAIKLSK